MDWEVAHRHGGSSSTWYLVELEFGNVGFWGEGKTGVPEEKPALGVKERTNNKLNPHGVDTGIWTRATPHDIYLTRLENFPGLKKGESSPSAVY